MRGRRMNFDGGQGYPVVYNADTSILVNGANRSSKARSPAPRTPTAS